jgi:hypothetical protein
MAPPKKPQIQGMQYNAAAHAMLARISRIISYSPFSAHAAQCFTVRRIPWDMKPPPGAASHALGRPRIIWRGAYCAPFAIGPLHAWQT